MSIFYPVKADDPIFENAEYVRDKVHFNVLDTRIRSAAAILLTNGSTIIMGQSNPAMSMWIWTSERVTSEDLFALKTALPQILSASEVPFFMARESVTDCLQGAFAPRPVIFEERLTSYKCENLLIPTAKGEIDYPSAEDMSELVEFLIGFQQECFDMTPSADEMQVRIQAYIDNKSAFVLKDNGVPQSMAAFGVPEYGYIKIGPVFTAKTARNHGYAAYLTARVCEHITAQGCTPILYADSMNPASNKAYQNIGFVSAGTLKGFKIGMGEQ